MANIGRETTLYLIQQLQSAVESEDAASIAEIYIALGVLLREELAGADSAYRSLFDLLRMSLPVIDKIYTDKEAAEAPSFLHVVSESTGQISLNNRTYTLNLSGRVFAVLKRFIENDLHVVELQKDLVKSGIYPEPGANLHNPISMIKAELKSQGLDAFMEIERIRTRTGVYQLVFKQEALDDAEVSTVLETVDFQELDENTKIEYVSGLFYDAAGEVLLDINNAPRRFLMFQYLFTSLGRWIQVSELMNRANITESSLSSTRSRMTSQINEVSALNGIFQIQTRRSRSDSANSLEWRMTLAPGFYYVAPNKIYKLKA